MKERIYVCHTYYHAYVAFLKELNLPKEKRQQATLVLSKMSNDFEAFGERVKKVSLFEDVIEFDEKKDSFFPELAKFRTNKGNIVSNMWNRIRYTKHFARLEAKFIPVNFKEYHEVYVFCDSDPIGCYLNQEKIPYHALEDGLNCLVHLDSARYDNRGMFPVKAFMSKRLNLIFVHNGYGKYCIDMEVNDISAITYPCPYYKQVPRQPLVDALTEEDKQIILHAFVRDMEELEQKIMECKDKRGKVLVLTDPLCSLEVRAQIFLDIVAMYEEAGQIFIKPHPRDVLDYHKVFPGYPIFDATVPMEMLNFFPGLHFDKVITVFTDLKGIRFADECIRLGDTFMDQYEDASMHYQNARIGIVEKD